MSDVKIKLCGMSRPEDIEAVNALMPDYIGFVFFAKSHRNVSKETAANLKAMLDKRIKAAGVFVDSTPEFVAGLVNDGIIDIAQLHGHEDNDYIATLRKLADCPIIQAFKIRGPEDIARAEASDADYVLLDNGTGTGECFDWSFTAGITRPFFLAGGLTPKNVKQAIAQTKPYAVDISSGIETDKKKDPDKMRVFCENARG